jgi:methionyl-tRNA formyltransferase
MLLSTNSKKKFGILASGGLGAKCTELILNSHIVSFVMTDHHSNAIIELCHQKNIPLFVGNPRQGRTKSFLSPIKTDVVLSINYLFIVERDIIDHPSQYAINFHGSLLPRYRGRTPHVWSIINNEKETGITAHLITEGCDEGDIVYQEKISIGPDDTGASILEQFTRKYPQIIRKVLDMIEARTIQPVPQNHRTATYFGKRAPEDGGIQWIWHKERIHNWVRAQASPYPGAFTWKDNYKITIHQIKYSSHGFFADMPDGLLLQGGQHPVVKTPNGAVELINFSMPEGVTLQEGDILK